MKLIIFACVHNAGRSQMVATFFNALADPRKACAVSAARGPPNTYIEVLEVMREVGLELSQSRPQLLTRGSWQGPRWPLLRGRPAAQLARDHGWMLADAARIDELDQDRCMRLFISIAQLIPEGNQLKADHVVDALAKDWPPALGECTGR